MISHHHLVQGHFAKKAVSLFVEHCMVFVVSLIEFGDAIVLNQTRVKLGSVRLLVFVEQGDQKVLVRSRFKVLGMFDLLVCSSYLFYHIPPVPYRGVLIILDS